MRPIMAFLGVLPVLLVSLHAMADRAGAQAGPVFIPSAGPVPRRAVPLEVADPNGVARRAWPVRGGVPLPRGELRSPENVRLLDGAGREVPVQTAVLGWWPEVTRPKDSIPASVMWLQLTFLADVPAGGKATFTLQYGTEVKAAARPAHPVRVRARADGVTLTNGLLTARLSKQPRFIESIAVGKKRIVQGGRTEMDTDISYKFGAMDYSPVVTLSAPEKPLSIDGKLDDPAWAKARQVTLQQFRLSDQVGYETKAMMLLDDSYLYVAFECADPDPNGIKAPRRGRDAYDIRDDDHVDVWLDPATTIYVDPRRQYPTGFVQIALSASGAVRDRVFGYGFPISKWLRAKRGTRLTGLELNLKGLRTATHRTDGGWQAELAIPLYETRLERVWKGKRPWHHSGHSLTDAKRHKDTIGVQLYRYRPARPGATGGLESRWPHSLSYTGLRPGKFARIPKPGAGRKDYDRLAEMATEPMTLPARAEVREVTVEESGPVVAVARVRGVYHHSKGFGSPFTFRVHLYADRKDLRTFHTVTTGFQTYAERMKRVSLVLPCAAKGQWSAGLAEGKALTADRGGELAQYRDDSFLDLTGSGPKLRAGRLSGWACVDAAGPMTVAARDFWQLYPGGCRVGPDGIRLDFYSPRAMPMYFGVPGEARNRYGDFSSAPHHQPQRVSRTHEVWLDLSGGDPAAWARSAARLLLPWAGKKWNCHSLAMGYLAAYDRDILPRLEDWCDYALWWFVNDQREDRWYGWGDFGNTPNTFTTRGVPRGHPNAWQVGYIFEGGYGWANDRKCIALSYLTQYFRSGRRLWFDFGEGVARNSMDVCTSYPTLSDEKPWPDWPEVKLLAPERRKLSFRPICCPRRHAQWAWSHPRGSASRQGGQPGWVLFYFLTGDRRARDVIEMRDLYVTTRGPYCWLGGGMCTSSPHGTRAQERRFLLLRWIMTGDPLYRRLIEGFHKKVYAKTLSEGKAVLALRYPWFVEPEKAWMWERQNEAPPPEHDLSRGGIAGMHVELGGWEAPVRLHQLTGDPWLAKVILKLSGPRPRLPARIRDGTPNWSWLYSDAYSAPAIREADMYRWTDEPGHLYRLTGYPSAAKFAAGRDVVSPVPPAEPEKPMDRRKLYARSMKFTFGAPAVFPAGYLWPTNVYYMGYVLHPLQQAVRQAKGAEQRRMAKPE